MYNDHNISEYKLFIHPNFPESMEYNERAKQEKAPDYAVHWSQVI